MFSYYSNMLGYIKMIDKKLIPLFYTFFQYFFLWVLERVEKTCKISVNSSKNYFGRYI